MGWDPGEKEWYESNQAALAAVEEDRIEEREKQAKKVYQRLFKERDQVRDDLATLEETIRVQKEILEERISFLEEQAGHIETWIASGEWRYDSIYLGEYEAELGRPASKTNHKKSFTSEQAAKKWLKNR